MSITVEEFASHVGLSASTISRALNSSPRVPIKTRQRVQSLAKELGYRPSFSARSLRKQVNQHVGVVIATLPGAPASIFLPIYSQFLVSLAEQLEAVDRGLLLATTSEPITPASAAVKLPLIADQLHADRLVVLSHMWPEFAREVKLLSMSAVVVDGPSCGLPAVQRDEEAAAEKLVDHLVEQGHRRIAFVNHGGGKITAGYRDVLWPRGYLKAITRHRLVPMPGWDLYEDLEDAIGRLLALEQPPTAMICYDDETALYAIQYLTDRGLSVPRDMSVAAMFDRGIGGLLPRPITRMVMPQVDMARSVLRLLLDEEIDDFETPAPIIRLAGELVAGQTVCPPRSVNKTTG